MESHRFFCVMVQQSSHRIPKYISRSVFIAGKMLVFLDSLDIPVSRSVVTCFNSMFLPSGSLASVVSENLTGSVVFVALLARFMFALESAIAKLLLEGEFGGVLIL